MAKPKAPRWLTEAFRDGVDELWHAVTEDGVETWRPRHRAAYEGASPWCWLAQFDRARQPCSLPIERFHFIPRQQVENAMYAMLLGAMIEETWDDWNGEEGSAGTADMPIPREVRDDLILLAAWDPRNGGLGCEHHHRRFDGHACSPRAPKIVVPFPQLPEHVFDYVDDYGFRGAGWLTERFPA